MQDKFVGDVGDFGKYGLLRTLAGIEPKAKPGYRLGIVWYFGDDGEPYDADVAYLPKPDEFRHYDDALFDALQDMANCKRLTVEEVRKRRFLGRRRLLGRNAVFFSDHVPDRQERDGWLVEALDRTRRTHIVLLDPDKALASSKMEAMDERSPEHAYMNEVEPFVKRGQTVVIYQSFGRNKGDTREKQIRRWHDECLTKLDLDEHPRIVTTSKRAFIILPATHHLERVTTRLDVLVKRWGTHFKHREL